MAEMTIKEVAEKYAMNKYDNWNLHPDDHFLAGAEYQEKRMYSEEEVLRIIKECKSYLSFGDEFNETEWFEQFKK
jgi:hypothetical protein